MLKITKQGNSIVVKGLDHALYPYSGTLEIPCNSIITVVDDSDIVTFRSANNYDVLFSGLVTDITINGESVTKENVGDKFGVISNTTSGGGLTPEQEDKLNNAVQIADYNADKAAQTTIDEAQNVEINKLKGDIAGKQDIIQDLNAIREGANLGKTALQEETDPIWTAEKGNYYTKSEVDTSLETKANKSEIPSLDGYATKVWVGEQGYLTEHQDISGKLDKTEAAETYQPKGNYATKSEIPSLDGYATESWVEGKGYLTEHQSLADYAKKSYVNTELEKKQDVITDLNAIREGAEKGATAIQEHQSLDGYATKVWVGEQGYLTEHQPLKTINGQTIVGDGNIEIQGGVGEETDPVWNAEKGNYYTKTEVNTSLETKANKSEIPSLNGYATEQWVGQQGYLTEHQSLKTINGQTIVGDGNIEITSGEETDPIWTAEKLNYYTKTEIDEMIGNINNALATLING